ncbi:thioredoxin family protein [Roseovarius sp. Pro17]|uniref:cytochrome c biogenesis protein CcdA n=1 Tax=Roseovarius sp. Pro17 TaxID=3108175 RepID=UPI002D77523C|nr:thioredoxin family protein [Roseovarius sp. Pro17]
MVLAGFLGFGLLLAFTSCVIPILPILAGILTGQDSELTTRRGALNAALSADSDPPAMIYVTADWCVTCRVVERNVWPDANVQAALSNVNLIAADMSDIGAEGQAMLDGLGAVGPPTMVFWDSNRIEALGSRIVVDTRRRAVQKSAEAIQ